MFRHYRVIFRELVISTSPSYKNIQLLVIYFKIKKFHVGFIEVLIIVTEMSVL
jgi:hypothetical protein